MPPIGALVLSACPVCVELCSDDTISTCRGQKHSGAGSPGAPGRTALGRALILQVEFHSGRYGALPGAAGLLLPVRCPWERLHIVLPKLCSPPWEADLCFVAGAPLPKIIREGEHEDSRFLLPSPRNGRPRRQRCVPASQGQSLLYRASALLSNDARQELGLRTCRLHILSVLFSNLCGKGEREG